MKKNKFLLIVGILSSILISSCSKIISSHCVSLIGSLVYQSVITKISEDKGMVSHTEFARQIGSYKEDFQLIDKDPLVHSGNDIKRASEIFEKSNLIIFSYDINDVMPGKDGDVYSEDNLKKDYALFDYYLELTFEEYREKSQACTVVLGLYEEGNSVYRGYLEDFNTLLMDKSLTYNMNFISTLFLGEYTKDQNINEVGIQKLSDLILDCYGK